METLSKKKALLFLWILFFGIVACSQSQTQKKIALVIGAQNYTAVKPLRHSLNDARDLTANLKGKGFEVITLLDPTTKQQIKDAITKYFHLMQNMDGGVGIIFYAGHGLQDDDGHNYLIPITANLQNPGDLDDQCVKLDYVMSTLRGATNSLSVVILDACRSGFSLPGSQRDFATEGLAKVEAPRGSIVVFAAEPGKKASDGVGKNGLLTSSLLKHMDEGNININEVFRRVKNDVFKQSNQAQLPMVEDASTGGDFYFSGSAAPTTTTQTIIKQESAATQQQTAETTEPAYTAFDYGYGPSDAPTVSVGSQQWLGKNLNTDRFANGDPIPQAQTNEEWNRAGEQHQPAWCYYNNDPANGRTYGKLYNWYAVHDTRGLAPTGWHVPSDDEWTSLTTYLGGETIAGTKMKSTSMWENYRGVRGNGDNSSGIAGLPGGYRSTDGTFYSMGKLGYWWSSSEYTTGIAWNRFLTYGFGIASRDGGDVSCGFSVRCVRD